MDKAMIVAIGHSASSVPGPKEVDRHGEDGTPLMLKETPQPEYRATWVEGCLSPEEVLGCRMAII